MGLNTTIDYFVSELESLKAAMKATGTDVMFDPEMWRPIVYDAQTGEAIDRGEFKGEIHEQQIMYLHMAMMEIADRLCENIPRK